MTSSEFRKEARNHLTGKWGKVALIVLVYMLIFFVFGVIEGFFKDNIIETVFSIIRLVIQVPLSFGLIITLLKIYKNEEVGTFDSISSGFSNFKRAWGVFGHILLKMIVPIILMVIVVITSIIFIASAIMQASDALPENSNLSTQLTYQSENLASDALLNPDSIESLDVFQNMDNESLEIFSQIVLQLGLKFIILFIAFIAIDVWILCKSLYYSLAYIIAAEEPELATKEAVEKSKELMTNRRGKLFLLELSFIGWYILLALVAALLGFIPVLSSIAMIVGMIFLLPYMQFAVIAFYNYVSGNKSEVVEAKVEETNNNPIQE